YVPAVPLTPQAHRTPLTSLAAELRQAPRVLDAFVAPGGTPDLRAVLTRSYRRLPAEHARLFRLLSPHPGPDLDAETAAALAGLPVRRARQVLDGLADAHLVREHTPGRYTQHELLRALAAELAGTYDAHETHRTAHPTADRTADRTGDRTTRRSVVHGDPSEAPSN
ncbi:hypothetical protein P1P70_41910, partial [Streptomyces sp. MB09-02B]|nr:hypothetical protein [Streptomyces sp. MB09-02B]